MPNRLAPFVDDHEGVHPRIVLDRFVPAKVPEPYQIGNITTVNDLYVWESFRASIDLRSSAAVPVDIFVWAHGEPQHRAATKVGGAPFWPRSRPWPRFGRRPATFLAQFNFSESLGLVPAIPGDILLLFVKDKNFFDELPNSLVGLWTSSSAADPISATECPPPSWDFATAFGARYRSYDDPSRREYARAKATRDGVWTRIWQLPVMSETKIGGFPSDAQSDDPEIPDGFAFLCSLGSILPRPCHPWPWLNVETPIPNPLVAGSGWTDDPLRELCLGDLDSLNIFVHPNGAIQPTGSLS